MGDFELASAFSPKRSKADPRRAKHARVIGSEIKGTGFLRDSSRFNNVPKAA
jgi:hypothetical protein